MKRTSTIIACLIAALVIPGTVFAKDRTTVRGNNNTVNGIVIGRGHNSIRPSSNIVTKNIAVGDFSKIDVSFVKLIINYGAPSGIAKLSAPDNLIDKVRIGCSNGELDIDLADNINIRGKANITVEVTAPLINEIDADLSANVIFNGDLRSNRGLELSASTSASIKAGKVTARSCEIDAETSAYIHIQDLAADGTVEINSETSASVKIGALSCNELEAEAETSASITANIESVKSADLEADTSGSVKLTGATIETGSAVADTSGSIKCSIARPTRIKHDTGGSVRNN